MEPTATGHTGPTPAYKRIQNSIRKQIKFSQLKPGDLVTSERELARIHKVSLMTARHALVGLEREGMVERRRGAGTFVAIPKIQFNKLMSYTELMYSRGLSPRSRVLFAKIISGDEEVTARLGLRPASELVKVECLQLSGHDPVALETSYLLAQPFSGIVDAPLGRRAILTILEQSYGVKTCYADEEIDATAADEKLAELLSVPVGSPVLRTRQVIYLTNGRAILYTVGLYNGEQNRFFIRRFR